MDWCKNIIDSIFIGYVRTWATEVSIKGRDSALGTDISSLPLLSSPPLLSSYGLPPAAARCPPISSTTCTSSLRRRSYARAVAEASAPISTAMKRTSHTYLSPSVSARPYPHRPHPSSADTPSLLMHWRSSIHPPSPSSPEYGYAPPLRSNVSHNLQGELQSSTHRRPSLSHRPPYSTLSRACAAQRWSEGGGCKPCATSAIDR